MKSFCILLLLIQYYFCANKIPDTDYEIYLKAKSASSTCEIKGHSRLIYLGGGILMSAYCLGENLHVMIIFSMNT